MYKLSLLVLLSICVLGKLSYADVEVWTTRRVASGLPDDPVQVTGATVTQRSGTSIFDVSFSYAHVLAASPGTNPNPDGWVVWVFDAAAATGDPVNSIGDVVIDMTTSPLNNVIRLLIAPAPIPNHTRAVPDFPASWDDPIEWPGALDLGSVSITPAGFEPQVTLSLNVAGNVGRAGVTPRDQVKTGQLYRIEVPGRPVNGVRVDGSIFADLIATGSDGLGAVKSGAPGGIRKAIGHVRAARSIKGNIVATREYQASQNDRNASIHKVRLFDTSLSNTEITGDILALTGSINEILTVGKIGTSESIRTRIEAPEGVFSVRAVSESSSTLLARDFFADIKSNLAAGPDTAERKRGAIHRLHTQGDYVGSLDVDYIRHDPVVAPVSPFGTDWGVIVGGTFTGDIRVRHLVLEASIAAKTFTPPTTEQPNQGHITIDHAIEGSIVATAVDGHIPFISIGRNLTVSVGMVAIPTFTGFLGSKAEPQTFPFVPFTPASLPRFAPMPAQPEPDSVIAAASIGHATILRMMRGAEKLTPPRIECPDIGELIIDDMRQGVVWSGRLEYHALDSEGRPVPGTDGRPRLADPQDRANDYSNIGSLTLGCVGPGADLWIEETPGVKITQHLLGELYLPRSPLGQTIRIDRRLGTGNVNPTTDDQCPCDTAQVPSDLCNDLVPGWPANTTPPATDPSPRNIGVATTGAIRIAEEMGLKGQFVINGGNAEASPADAWTGAVVVGEQATTPIVLSPTSVSPYTAPYYETSSAFLGGGAVGLVPFRLHEIDCEPPHRVRENPSNPVLDLGNAVASSAFASAGARPVKVRFYGPVLIDSGVSTSPIDAASENAPEACERTWTGASGMFSVAGPGSGATGIDARTMSIGRNASASEVHEGVYRVRVRPKHAPALAPNGTRVTYWPVCTDEDDSAAYFFRVADGVPVDCHSCPGDFNCSTTISVQDIFDFLTAYFTAICSSEHDNTPGTSAPCFLGPDINDSGTTTIQDLFDFLSHWFSGC